METKVKENGTAVNKEVKGANPVTVENKNPKFVAGNAVNKESAKPEADKVKETPKAPEPQKAEPAKSQEQPNAAPVKAEEPKAAPAPEPKKVVLNLDGTLKLVEELHRKKIQRDKLLETITNLDDFEFDLKEEADETGGNFYQGCLLTIVDDDNRKFTTKNPTIIWTVAQMVNRLCVDKLAEIEASITIPA